MLDTQILPSQFGITTKEIFKSPKELLEQLTAVSFYLQKHVKKTSKQGLHFFIVEKLQVNFTDEVSEIQLELKYGSQFLTVHVPKKSYDAASLQAIQFKILAILLPSLTESQLRSTLQFWLCLKPKARQQLKKQMNIKGKKNV